MSRDDAAISEQRMMLHAISLVCFAPLATTEEVVIARSAAMKQSPQYYSSFTLPLALLRTWKKLDPLV
ncbi:MAG: hypothetical protein JSW49_01925 [candidate division WOR-3 bacterium]|nr:MAG: hypothetical protein JSW49_01925 [candidate division WOR-3 bacterium]